MSYRITIVLYAGLLALTTRAEDLYVREISGNGQISWQDTRSNGTYAVEWCPTLQSGDWRRDWLGMAQIPSRGGIITVKIPMFFRIIHRPRQSQTRNLCLVVGGGQPGGPSYDFYMAKYEVTNGEFMEFLNDAQMNVTNARGTNLCFLADGEIRLGSKDGVTVFKPYGTWMLYNQYGEIGSRYACQAGFMDHPVVGVSWYGAVKFCNWLTIREGRGEEQRCYSEGRYPSDWRPAHLSQAQWQDGFDRFERALWVETYEGFRLPMDDYKGTASEFNEFFKAAAWNGTTNTTYAFGRYNINGQDANFFGSGDPYDRLDVPTTPVGYYDGTDHAGAFQTRSNGNASGIFDLTGNVWEWMTDPGQYGTTAGRGFRGGGWENYQAAVPRCFQRQTANDYDYSPSLGFRVVSMRP